jgi:DNA-binding HxlR family transcriptional regulator
MMLAERQGPSFRELLQLAKPMNGGTLNHRLKTLMKAGLVKNDCSFYQLKLGRDFLRQIGAF